jgi:tRNA G18 (ribose-2'-O)-methylase SpoU
VIQHIDSVSDERVSDYRDVRDGDLLRERSLFMVEGRANLRRLIEESPYRPRSVFFSKPAYEAMAQLTDRLARGTPVFVASREVLSEIAGFDIHRGCLAAGERPAPVPPATVLAEPGRPSVVVVLEGLTDPDNVGAVYRNAMAFGVDAVLLCPRCCDPLYRKAIRVSMGAALCVATARVAAWPAGIEEVRAAGYRVVALDPAPDALELGASEVGLGGRVGPGGMGGMGGERTALLLGTEANGLSPGALALADERLRIPMVEGFDSLNVATASGVALHHFFARGRGA